MNRPVQGALLLAVGASCLCACGWHAGIAAPAGARSVGVDAVGREATVLERGLEPLLTDALSEAVVNWVDLPLAAPAEADLVVRCQILDFRRRGGVRNRDNQLLETAVFVRARAEVFDRRQGRSSPPAFAQEWSGYTLDDQLANEDAARNRALRVIAETLILDLFRPDGAEASATPPR